MGFQRRFKFELGCQSETKHISRKLTVPRKLEYLAVWLVRQTFCQDRASDDAG